MGGCARIAGVGAERTDRRSPEARRATTRPAPAAAAPARRTFANAAAGAWVQRRIYKDAEAKRVGEPYARLGSTAWYRGLTEDQRKVADALHADLDHHYTPAEADVVIAERLAAAAMPAAAAPAAAAEARVGERRRRAEEEVEEEKEAPAKRADPVAGRTAAARAAVDAVRGKLPHGLGNIDPDIRRSGGLSLLHANHARDVVKNDRGFRREAADLAPGDADLVRAIKDAAAGEIAHGARCAEAAAMVYAELLRTTIGVPIHIVTDTKINHAFVLLGDPAGDDREWVVADAWKVANTGPARRSAWWDTRAGWTWGTKATTNGKDYVSKLVADYSARLAPKGLTPLDAQGIKDLLASADQGTIYQ
jgi:hypothetical protein